MSEPSAPSRGPEAHVLWGRVATAVVVVLVAFGAGRCSADGVPEEEVSELEQRVSTLQDTNEDLRDQVADLDRQLSEAATPDPSPSPSPDPTEPADAPSEQTEAAPLEGAPGGIWTVEPGDTLQAIAIEVYSDRAMAQEIGAANGLEPGATLQVGQVLQLPLTE